MNLLQEYCRSAVEVWNYNGWIDALLPSPHWWYLGPAKRFGRWDRRNEPIFKPILTSSFPGARCTICLLFYTSSTTFLLVRPFRDPFPTLTVGKSAAHSFWCFDASLATQLRGFDLNFCSLPNLQFHAYFVKRRKNPKNTISPSFHPCHWLW